MEKRNQGEFHCFRELETAVTKDVVFLRTCGVVSKSTVISGWVYDVEYGTTERVTRGRDESDITQG
jgi:carbonic anhydrase